MNPFIELELDGKHCIAVPLTKDFAPTTLEQAELVKVIYDDGSVTFFTKQNKSGQNITRSKNAST